MTAQARLFPSLLVKVCNKFLLTYNVKNQTEIKEKHCLSFSQLVHCISHTYVRFPKLFI